MEFISAKEAVKRAVSGEVLLDVRAQVEYRAGALPGSVNLPILNDRERELVGKTYVEQGQYQAIELGHSLVSGPVRRTRTQRWIESIAHNQISALYCARGGMRSELSQSWIADEGIRLPRVEGGYKAIRQHLLRSLEESVQEVEFIVVTGPTGSGKTPFLKHHAQSHPVIDLEGLACHKGSAFGLGLVDQPSQANFENNLAVELLQLLEKGATEIYFEDESRAIGKVTLPEFFFAKIDSAERVLLDVSLEDRVAHIYKEYVEEVYQVLSHQEGSMKALDFLESKMLSALARISRALGDLRYRKCKALIEEAFADHRDNEDSSKHMLWIEYILTNYYDPYYTKHLAKKKPLIRSQIDRDGNVLDTPIST